MPTRQLSTFRINFFPSHPIWDNVTSHTRNDVIFVEKKIYIYKIYMFGLSGADKNRC